MSTFFTLSTALFTSVYLYYTCILSQHHFKHTVHEDKSNLQCIHVNWVSRSKYKYIKHVTVIIMIMKWVSCICWNSLRIEYFVYLCNNHSSLNNFTLHVVNRCEDLSTSGLTGSVSSINLFWVNTGRIATCSVTPIKPTAVSKTEKFTPQHSELYKLIVTLQPSYN